MRGTENVCSAGLPPGSTAGGLHISDKTKIPPHNGKHDSTNPPKRKQSWQSGTYPHETHKPTVTEQIPKKPQSTESPGGVKILTSNPPPFTTFNPSSLRKPTGTIRTV